MSRFFEGEGNLKPQNLGTSQFDGEPRQIQLEKLAQKIQQQLELQNNIIKEWTRLHETEKKISLLMPNKVLQTRDIATQKWSSKCKTVAVEREKRHQFPWLIARKWPEFPKEILRYVVSYLNDEDRFRLRGLSLFFYETYYCQHINEDTKPFNDERAIKLARKGRRFTNIEHLQTRYVSITAADLQFISPYHFPSLKSFFSDRTVSEKRFARLRHPLLVKLSVLLEKPREARCITEQRFPNLQILDVDFRERGAELGAINPHRILKRLICPKVKLGANFFLSISRAHFPKLECIEMDSRVLSSNRAFIDLRTQFGLIGIRLENVTERGSTRV